MTEDEAKEKWCPFARVGSDHTGLGSINRDWAKGPNTHATNCIGSACMAWRFTNLDVCGDPLTTHGFCGLAGKP